MRYGLAGIKGVGFTASDSLVSERKENGAYKGYMDFIERQSSALNKKSFESLIYAGALDCFGYHRAALLEDLPSAMKRAEKAREDKASGQISLFAAFGAFGGADSAAGGANANAGSAIDDDAEIRAIHEDMPRMPLLELLAKEKETVGMFVSGHPIAKYRHITRACQSVTEINAKLAALNEKLTAEKALRPADAPPEPIDWKARRKGGEKVRFCALVADVQYKFQKDGQRMCALNLEDETDESRLVIFGRDLARLTSGIDPRDKSGAPPVPRPEPAKNELLIITAEIAPNYKGEEAQLTIQDYTPLSEASARLASSVTLSCTEENFRDLAALLKQHPGTVPVTISLRLKDKIKLQINCGASLRVHPDESFATAIDALLGPNKLAASLHGI
jgi:DNA polymerase III, alpha subunit